MAYYGNDEDYEGPSEPYGDDEGSELEQQIEQEEQELMMLQQMQAEQEKQRKVEERLLKNQLKQILRDVAGSGAITLKSVPTKGQKKSQKQIVKEAKAFPNLKKEIKDINLMLSANKAKNTSKLMSSSPVLFYVGIGALIIFLIIAVISIIGSIVGSLKGMFNSIYGVSGADFYGVRMVYENDELASKKIIEDYVEIVEKSVDEIQGINAVTVGESTYSVALQLEITLPRDANEGGGYNFDEFDETTFQTEYSLVYDIVLEMAKSTYKSDYENDEENAGAEYSDTSLIECVSGIKYFGIGSVDEIKTILTTDLLPLLQATSIKDETEVEVTEESVKTEIINQIKTDATAKLNAVVDANSARARKLFVKDYILNGEDERVSGVETEQYIALIFMPRTGVTFTKLSFVVGETDLNEFNINVGDKEFKTDEANIGIEEGQQAYIYSTKLLFNQTVSEFEDIDKNNLTALAEEVSLYDILTMENVDSSIYLIEMENGIYTLKANGVVVEFENDTPFNVVEYETNWVDTIG